MFSAEDAETVKALVAKGSLGAGVFETADCQKTFEELSAKGVTFLQEPAERPYGIEALFRDDSGNWFSLTSRSRWVYGAARDGSSTRRAWRSRRQSQDPTIMGSIVSRIQAP